MYKFVFTFFFIVSGLFAQTFQLNNENSKVYYEASKDQFFMNFKVLGINKTIKGDLEINENSYKGKLYIDSSKFDSDNSFRDNHVREDYLKSEDFPFIRFDYTIQGDMAKGIILIAGVPKQIKFPVEIVETTDNLNIKGKIQIKYSDFAIKTPETLILKANDELIIGANLNFKK